MKYTLEMKKVVEIAVLMALDDIGDKMQFFDDIVNEVEELLSDESRSLDEILIDLWEYV